MVAQYSSRQLTNEGDALDAFLGVMHHMRQSRPSAYTLCGLPIFKPPDREAIFFEYVVSAALSWYPDIFSGDCALKRRCKFPSWTWVGWQGLPVHFLYSSYSRTMVRPFLRQLQLETSSGEILELRALWNRGNQEEVQQALDTVSTICFEAPTLPADYISHDAHGDKHEITTNSNLHGDMFSVAGRRVERYRGPDFAIMHNLIENVRNGIWSCLILGGRKMGKDHSRFVLVISWEEDQLTAERIGIFVISPNDIRETNLGPLEEKLGWRRVRLI